MLSLNDRESETLRELGSRLRARRIDSCDAQKSFAARIGVSVPTYRKLEMGDPTVPIGAWVRAMRLLGALGEIEDLLPLPLLSDVAGRKRVSKRRFT